MGSIMNKDFPSDINQVLFPLINMAIYLKCKKANKVIALLGHNLQISHTSATTSYKENHFIVIAYTSAMTCLDINVPTSCFKAAPL